MRRTSADRGTLVRRKPAAAGRARPHPDEVWGTGVSAFPEPLGGEPLHVLLRHADAGTREEWSGPDDWRGLTPLGHAQAREVVSRLGGLPILRVLSSPSLRCRQTVVPLARELSLDVEPCRPLAIGADPEELMRFLQDTETEGAVLCTHRETLQGLFARLATDGMVIAGGVAQMEKAAAWMLYGVADGPNGLRWRYLPSREAGAMTGAR